MKHKSNTLLEIVLPSIMGLVLIILLPSAIYINDNTKANKKAIEERKAIADERYAERVRDVSAINYQVKELQTRIGAIDGLTASVPPTSQPTTAPAAHQ